MQAFVLCLQAGHKSVNLTNCNKSRTLISDQHIFKSWLNCVFNFTRTLLSLQQQHWKLKKQLSFALLVTLSSLMLFQLKKSRFVNVDNFRSSLLPTRGQAKLLNRVFTARIFRALFFLSKGSTIFFFHFEVTRVHYSNENFLEEMVLSNTRKTHYTFSHECELFCNNICGIQRNKLPYRQCHPLSMDVSRLTSLLGLCGICDDRRNCSASFCMNRTGICTSQGSRNCLFFYLFRRRCADLIRLALYNSSTPVQLKYKHKS